MSTEIAEDTRAEPVFPYHRWHPIEYEAVFRLRELEYTVTRTDGSISGVNLIAMKGGHFRFVCISRRKTRAGTIAEVAATYFEELDELRQHISPVVSVDLWIWCRQDRWRYFAVFPGGIQEIGGDDACRL
ncbi:hypothetical protein [Methanosphaerula subterraneus]|uniref:hypothetical protein n=1 Tax=Methanosphaerula subterraneus TaxID=3350244 RepID=UPI003F82A295